MPSGQMTSRFKKVTAPSLLRQKPDSGFNKNLKMAKMSPATDNTNRKTLPAEGKKRSAFEKSKSPAGSKGLAARTADGTKANTASNVAKPSMTQDTPDFTVLDVKQEEFEQLGEPLSMALDRRKSGEEDEEGVRGKLIFAVSSLTQLLGAEQLQKKGEVFDHLRQITDLCNSLPEEAGTGQPLQLKHSSIKSTNSSQKQNALLGNCDKTLATCDADSEDNQERRSSGVYDFTPNSQQKDKQRKESLGRVPSIACDVSSYFEEQ